MNTSFLPSTIPTRRRAHFGAIALALLAIAGCASNDDAANATSGSGGPSGAGGATGATSGSGTGTTGSGMTTGPGGGGSIPGSGPACAAVSADPDIMQAFPSVYLDTTYAPATGKSTPVHAGDDLQAAIDAAQPGDELVLDAGATFTGPFTLRAKQGDAWIVIRSSGDGNGLPAPGTRVAPSDAAKMATILAPQADSTFKTENGAHNYRLIGLELAPVDASTLIYTLVELGDPSTTDTTQFPHDLIFDRIYAHGYPGESVKRAFQMNSASTSVIDSYISECHVVGQDAQALGGWAGPGPYKIVNNYLEGSGENFLMGGADPAAQNLVPSDIQFELNYVKKPLSWKSDDPSYAGNHYTVKNLFELKNARRVLAQCNIFENNWVDGQSGIAIVLTPRNQDGTAPWSTVEDVTFINNRVVNATGGVNMLGTDNDQPSQRMQRVVIANNVFDQISGLAYQLLGPAWVKYDHNTTFQGGNIISADNVNDHFFFTNNINPHNAYGIIGSNHGVGNDSITTFFPGGVFSADVIAGGNASSYPSGNFFPPALTDVGFVDMPQGNYALAPSSAYAGKATDGKDVGVDFAALTQKLANVP